jgi:hypothetical protein
LAQYSTTTTTVTTTATRDGFQLVVDPQSNTQVVGNFVTDISIQPYIAERIISFYGYNLRPNQTLHVFFDSVRVDQYCAPGAKVSDDTSDWQSVVRTGNWGDPIVTDGYGKVAGQFHIPEGVFKTGDRVLELTDADDLTLGADAMTTMASSVFTASNLSVTKQIVTLTTVTPEMSYLPVSNVIVTQNTFTTTVVRPDIYNVMGSYYEPIAQGLTINTPGGEAGIYALGVDLYFKKRAQIEGRGVVVYLCETDNGYPNGDAILPFSVVHVDYDDIGVSEDASVKTAFNFQAPVFMANGRTYAFVVKPDANDPDFWVYSAQLGDVDIDSGVQVSAQPVIGTAFYGATQNQWTALQTEYIKFILRAALFNQGTGDVVLNNDNVDYLTVYNIGYANTSAAILPGDVVFQSTNSTPSTANTSKRGLVDYFDSTRQILYVANSTGNFTANSNMQVHRFSNSTIGTPNTTTLVAYANTYNLYNPVIDAVVPQVSYITPPGTTATFFYSGVSNTYAADTREIPVNPGYETEMYDKERIVAGKSNEVASYSSNKTMKLRARLTSDSPLLSPAIDTIKLNQLALRNRIDPISSNYNEFYNSGRSLSKYVSQVITLADGQDAEDLQIVLSAYKPPTSDVQVWVKFLNGEDPESISAKTWTPMRSLGAGVYSDPSNPKDFKEFVYAVPYSYPLIPTTGGLTGNTTSANVSGTATLFGTECYVGWWINMKANTTVSQQSRQIVSIASNTTMVLNAPFTAEYTNTSYYVVPPPTTAWLSSNATYALTGKVEVSNATNVITGNGTNFALEVQPGSIINVIGDNQIVVSVTNSTSLVVETPWIGSATEANASIVSGNGLTYLNGNNSRYTSFKRFQIKIILQSDDPSKVPILDDLRALALQL